MAASARTKPKSWPWFSQACISEVSAVLRSGRLTAYRANPSVGVGPSKGSQAYCLEREIESRFKVKHAVAVNSGTAALHAALEAVGVRGFEVIVSPFTFSASVSAILMAGGVPRFADVDPDTFCLSAESVNRVITKRTACILPVHLFGYFQDMSEMLSLGPPVIEDACQAVGAVRADAFSGTAGLAGVYSFNGSKNLPSGEGGCLVTNDGKIAEKARAFVNHQENFGYESVSPNYRMHEVVAVLARHGLRQLDERNNRRRELARAFYTNCPFPAATDDSHVYYVTPFKVHGWSRDPLVKRCKKRGLTVGSGYIQPTLDKYPAFRKYVTHDLPVAHELSQRSLCLLYGLTPDKPLSYARWCAKVIGESL